MNFPRKRFIPDMMPLSEFSGDSGTGSGAAIRLGGGDVEVESRKGFRAFRDAMFTLNREGRGVLDADEELLNTELDACEELLITELEAGEELLITKLDAGASRRRPS
ncbi:hypothetical protein PG996_009398 [Apiospora saccharicola]|uniref:Uncharacterized protein n=1 Tax=Apiospora saccharicola TaxID=335842 RepID=A0ABR1UKN8_9PEZI